jgi:hypothetical protein
MGIAAYNRGSRAISNQLYPQDVRYVAPKVKQEDPLPEGVLRSSFMPDSDTQIFLSYKNGWYLVHTRFQIMKRKRSYDAAVKLFERVEMYGRCALSV